MFATTGALAPQRSAERKVRRRKGEGVRMNKQAKVSNSYVGSIGLYKRIVNAVTQSIRIANADGQGFT